VVGSQERPRQRLSTRRGGQRRSDGRPALQVLMHASDWPVSRMVGSFHRAAWRIAGCALFRLFAGRAAFRSWGDGAENHEQFEIEPGRRFSARRPVRSSIGLATARRPPRSPPGNGPARRADRRRCASSRGEPIRNRRRQRRKVTEAEQVLHRSADRLGAQFPVPA
jgi:hypothetical protein